MWKVLLFSFFLLAFWQVNLAQAKIKIIDATVSNSVKIDDFEVKLIDPSLENCWAVELRDSGIANIQQLGVYPSYKSISFQVDVSGQWEYKSVDSDNIDWAPLEGVIRENKILLRSVSALAPVKDDLSFAFQSSLDNLTVSAATEDVTIRKTLARVKNNDLHLISSFYKIEAEEQDYDLNLIYNEDNQTSKSLYSYNQESGQWTVIQSYNNFPEKVISAKIRNQVEPLIVAAFENFGIKDGIASFYDQSRYRNFNYQNGNFAASRDYAKGTKLKVTRLLSGESIDIIVNDYGPEEGTGRLIDLDIAAFEQIGSTRAGLIYVKVEPYD
ncbi:MAG: hypothetical protein COV55_00080 [Candidatus Komeilibacteria bacterium CG11_big_fil_rev_8_21_14_0_20_36_20]|uniref:RlpA-like protein double-psi beta-barrel domain-containing protein n=1 Tax=Candidatus Komeilibacteria bacterium CG11_big_fil_rev_8_21_14_0_20_36_20 TaxID=1974477 RepID=A0A2H0NEQ4_9BACT|nr:MAG: hypothetical protein COV55_00080 [Candidatus Komeilibacteria bacterium CG11_big_fil_rev_8_21_14_0_20_36_20]PIR81184.1 MAG: hypothetical protein COU21_04925 [Candidatus Komeilibacteria bacterium CG10_big_fil_rev_8_21_14_0_10_36_65]PJC55757.1 MAG: hypothetical protein CO027_00345 [Candidatus Komeilibacteria bacterium CG_4_9_14_0_2_um_filter_36_13]